MRKKRAPLPCDEHGHTTIVTCLNFLLISSVYINGEQRFTACLNRSGFRFPNFDAFNSETAN